MDLDASGIGGAVSRRFIAAMLAVLLAGVSVLAYTFRQRVDTVAQWNRQVELANAEADHIRRITDPVAKKNFPEFAALREKWLPLLQNPDLLRPATAAPATATVSVGAH